MRSSGRPRTAQVQLKDGFYIEVCNKGFKKGIKIWSASKKEMDETAGMYTGSKEVIIHGEYKSGAPVEATPVS